MVGRSGHTPPFEDAAAEYLFAHEEDFKKGCGRRRGSN
jgi:hypothetical protein